MSAPINDFMSGSTDGRHGAVHWWTYHETVVTVLLVEIVWRRWWTVRSNPVLR